jgi:hypothetical protein
MARRKAKGGRRKTEDEGALLSGFYFLLSPFAFRLSPCLWSPSTHHQGGSVEVPAADLQSRWGPALLILLGVIVVIPSTEIVETEGGQYPDYRYPDQYDVLGVDYFNLIWVHLLNGGKSGKRNEGQHDRINHLVHGTPGSLLDLVVAGVCSGALTAGLR